MSPLNELYFGHSLKEWFLLIVMIYLVGFLIMRILDWAFPMWNTKKPRTINDIDLLEEIRIAHYKDAKAANKGRFGRRVILNGDENVKPISYKFLGLLPSQDVTEIFVKESWRRHVWLMCPTDLISDWHSKNIRINARALIRHGIKFHKPVFTKEHKNHISYYNNVIDRYIDNMLNFENSITAKENKLNTIALSAEPPYMEQEQIIARSRDLITQPEESTNDGYV